MGWMSRSRKTLEKVLSGHSDANISFRDLRGLLVSLGFVERVKGDHHIFFRDGIPEIINVQPKGSSSKPYQVKQVRQLINRYQLRVKP